MLARAVPYTEGGSNSSLAYAGALDVTRRGEAPPATQRIGGARTAPAGQSKLRVSGGDAPIAPMESAGEVARMSNCLA
jgi:hypothetical protein